MREFEPQREMHAGPESIGPVVPSTPMRIEGLTPDIPSKSDAVDEAGNEKLFAIESNFSDLNNNTKLREALTKQLNERSEWLHGLQEDISNNKKSAMFMVGLGSITVFVAAAGFEFGVRHGRDINQLFKHLRPKGKGDKS